MRRSAVSLGIEYAVSFGTWPRSCLHWFAMRTFQLGIIVTMSPEAATLNDSERAVRSVLSRAMRGIHFLFSLLFLPRVGVLIVTLLVNLLFVPCNLLTLPQKNPADIKDNFWKSGIRMMPGLHWLMAGLSWALSGLVFVLNSLSPITWLATLLITLGGVLANPPQTARDAFIDFQRKRWESIEIHGVMSLLGAQMLYLSLLLVTPFMIPIAASKLKSENSTRSAHQKQVVFRPQPQLKEISEVVSTDTQAFLSRFPVEFSDRPKTNPPVHHKRRIEKRRADTYELGKNGKLKPHRPRLERRS